MDRQPRKAPTAQTANGTPRGISSALLDTLLATAPAGLGFWDRELRYLRINDALAAINGIPAEAHLGRTIREVLPELAPSLEPIFRRALETGEPIVDLEVSGETPAGHGQLRHWLTSYYPVRGPDGRTLGVGAVVMDITERKRAEEALRFLAEAGTILSSSLDYEATLESVAKLAVPHLADWAFVELLQGDGSIRRLAMAHVDPSKEALAREYDRQYPIDPRAPEGSAKVIRTGFPELIPEIPDALFQAVAQDPEQLRILREVSFKSCMIVPLRVRGRIIGDLAFASAESGRRFGPNDLALAENLADRCAAAIDNARLYREARDAVRTRDDFLASAAHDLKSPLSSIRGLAHLAGRRAARIPTPEAAPLAEMAARIDATASKMARLINELLDFSRLRTGQPLDLERRATDLVALARDAVEEHRGTSGRHRLRLQTTEQTLVGLWDGFRLERVLANLLGNAIKYSPNGGRITVELRREEQRGHPEAILEVRDQGVGIPPTDLPHIFTQFHRGRNVSEGIAGTGIGLAGAHRIVQQHGGTISVESWEGLGSTFTVRLPLDPVNGPQAR